MATPSQDPKPLPLNLELAVAVLSAAQHMAHRQQAITPTTLARCLKRRTTTPSTPLPQIAAVWHQIRHWQQHEPMCILLQRYQELIALRARVQEEQRRANKDAAVIERLLQEVRAGLENSGKRA